MPNSPLTTPSPPAPWPSPLCGSPPSRRLARLDWQQSYTLAELTRTLRLTPAQARSELLRGLRHGQLHIIDLHGPRYGLTPPTTPPALTGRWQMYVAQLQGNAGLLSAAQLQALWTLSPGASSRVALHLVTLGHLRRFGRHYTLPRPSLPASEPSDAPLSSLPAVAWPASAERLQQTWGLSADLTAAYLHTLQRARVLRRHGRLFYPVPRNVLGVHCRLPRTLRPGEQEPYKYQERLREGLWPTTISQAAVCWQLDYYTAAQVLHRLVRRGDVQRLEDGLFNLTAQGAA